MTRNLILTGLLLIATAIASGCSSQPTDAEFGDAVRNVMEYQIHDYEAALHPPPDAVEGSDPDRLNSVIDAHRKGAAEAQEAPPPVTIRIGGL
jgi:hypothetical protein